MDVVVPAEALPAAFLLASLDAPDEAAEVRVTTVLQLRQTPAPGTREAADGGTEDESEVLRGLLRLLPLRRVLCLKQIEGLATRY